MTSWKPTPRTPAKTKEELREMLAQAVRNTQPETETKPLPKAKKVAASVAALGAQIRMPRTRISAKVISCGRSGMPHR